MSGAQYIEHGNGRPWHKRVLIPFWVFQILFMGVEVIGTGFGIYLVSNANNVSTSVTVTGDGSTYTSSTGTNTITTSNGNTVAVSIVQDAVIAVYAVILAIAVIGLLFTFVEIILFARHHLTPTKYFVFNLLKFLAWTAIFCVAIAGSIRYGITALSLVVNIVVELLFVGTLIYASVIFHHFRKERLMGAYQAQVNKEPYGNQASYGAQEPFVNRGQYGENA
ncbi:hypothetical protein MMC13_003820 [Lambiella insularis]|nr:hypothetical protein [Lambiella insularis]